MEPEQSAVAELAPEPVQRTGPFGTADAHDKIENALLIVTGRFAEGACKFILFSDNTHIFTTIQRRLLEAGLTCTSLDGGSSDAIERDSQSFCSGDTDVLMVDSSLFGCGMNFEMVTDVVIMHKLHPGMRSQVIGRAQRPGRSSQLNVWQLLHYNERS